MERSSTKALQRLETVVVMLVSKGDSSYQLCEALSRRGLRELAAIVFKPLFAHQFNQLFAGKIVDPLHTLFKASLVFFWGQWDKHRNEGDY